MWCHLTFRCQSNWLTGEKNQQQKACSCQSHRGGCQRRWEEQDWGPCRPKGWGKAQGEQANLVSGYPGPERCKRKESATSWSILPHPLPSSTGVWDPLEEQTLTPSQESGMMGFSHFVKGFDLTVAFFPCPCSQWRKVGFKKKKKKLFLSWPLGKKAELNKSLILVIFKSFRLFFFFYPKIFYWF